MSDQAPEILLAHHLKTLRLAGLPWTLTEP